MCEVLEAVPFPFTAAVVMWIISVREMNLLVAKFSGAFNMVI